MSISKRADIGLIVALPAFVTLAFLVGGTPIRLGILGLVGVLIGAWIGLRHPLYLYRALAVSLGALPYGYFPGFHIPFIFAFSIAVTLAALIHRTDVSRITRLESVVLLLLLTSAVSVVITGRTFADYFEFIKWVIATLVIISLLRLPRDQLAAFGRLYVYSASAAAAFALVIYAVDPAGKLISYLSPLGYGKEADVTRLVYSGDSTSVRLAGTFIDPNAAGISLFVALLLCVSLLSGRVRAILAVILFAAIVLTLSRSALFSVVGGVVLMVLFQNLRIRERVTILGAFVLAFIGALVTPSVRSRVFSSFGSGDAGSSARGDALVDFPGHMAGHWNFGLGWGRIEFTDPTSAFEVNYVANSPLLTVYRGGVYAGIAFTLVLVVGAVMGYQCLRSSRWEYGFVGGGFIAFSLVALQLDFPVVTIPAVTTTFSVLIVFVIFIWERATGNESPSANDRETVADATDSKSVI